VRDTSQSSSSTLSLIIFYNYPACIEQIEDVRVFSHWACAKDGRVEPFHAVIESTESEGSSESIESLVLLFVLTVIIAHAIYAFRDWLPWTGRVTTNSKLRVTKPVGSESISESLGSAAHDDASVRATRGGAGGAGDDSVVHLGLPSASQVMHNQQQPYLPPWTGPPIVPGNTARAIDVEGHVTSHPAQTTQQQKQTESILNRFTPFLPTVHEDTLPTTMPAVDHSLPTRAVEHFAREGDVVSGVTTAQSQTTCTTLDNTLSIKEVLAASKDGGRQGYAGFQPSALSTKFGPLTMDKKPTTYSPSKMSSRLSSSSGSQRGRGRGHRDSRQTQPQQRFDRHRDSRDGRRGGKDRASSGSMRGDRTRNERGRDRRDGGGGARRKYDDYDSFDSQYDSESYSDSEYDSESYSSRDESRRHRRSDRRRSSRSDRSRGTPKHRNGRQQQTMTQMMPVPIPMAQYPYAPFIDPYYRQMPMAPPAYPAPYFDPRMPPPQYGMYPPSNGDTYAQQNPNRPQPHLHIDTRAPLSSTGQPGHNRQRNQSEEYYEPEQQAMQTKTPVKGGGRIKQQQQQQQQLQQHYDDEDGDNFYDEAGSPGKQKLQPQSRHRPSKQSLQQPESPRVATKNTVSAKSMSKSNSSNSLLQNLAQ